ncbi:alpha/beta fold hydrolase [Hoeflea prorocentri]|uniref:Alpha/beta hydrolase n=1 Tax=Hoeflea prorocentri TaxID=1922333 RepID=A0A9X3UEP4_9HYPH|nr:alpha/beta hydrolase [Hoeflea prorocentri]MCY6379268.1 alpha/beta hydrolase [Hoeflea prorocentri]MDA5397069.1 alpha/beta hydrolase [Hoeflea prorocentri]
MYAFPFITVTVIATGLILFSWIQSRRIERLYPPIGEFVDVGGYRLHALHIPAAADADLPAIVFLHGASGNLRDQVEAFRQDLEGRAELLFVDRPGHGWSDRGGGQNALPDAQARAVAELMERKGIKSGLIVGHSFGGVIAANMALETPEKVDSLLLLATVSHPWPGGIDWHYHLATTPFIGRLAAWLIAMPAGLLRISRAARCVFSPNHYPPDYLARSGTALVLRPWTFKYNAHDVASLYDHIVRTSPRYGEIDRPTIVVAGDEDFVVSTEIHSRALTRQIERAELHVLRGVGHKPDYAATEVCIAAMEKLGGKEVDLAAIARKVERDINAGGETTNPPPSIPKRSSAINQIPVMPSEPI